VKGSLVECSRLVVQCCRIWSGVALNAGVPDLLPSTSRGFTEITSTNSNRSIDVYHECTKNVKHRQDCGQEDQGQEEEALSIRAGTNSTTERKQESIREEPKSTPAQREPYAP